MRSHSGRGEKGERQRLPILWQTNPKLDRSWPSSNPAPSGKGWRLKLTPTAQCEQPDQPQEEPSTGRR